MEVILNPFDKIDPIGNYTELRDIILKIQDKEILLLISEMLQKRLKEFK